MSHSILPPSSASMWGKCSGWVTLNACVPETEESEEARIGTAVHEVCASMLRGELGAPYSPEMGEAAMVFIDEVQSVTATRTGDLRIEQAVQCKRIHDQCFGTPDASFWDAESSTLFIWDYKHGMGAVEVFENEQLITYASGLMDLYGVEPERVVMRIVQPRAFHRQGPIREWVCKGSDLRPYINRLANAASLNLSGADNCQSGSHCRYCNARHVCESAIGAGVTLYEAASTPVPVDMSAEAMGTYYTILTRAIKHLESLKAGFEAQIVGRILCGEPVQGWTLQEGFGHRKWRVDAPTLFQMGDAIGIDLRKAVEPISPAQAEKLGFDKATVEALTVKPSTGAKLVQSDPAKIFKPLKG